MPAGLLIAALLSLAVGRVHARLVERRWEAECRDALRSRLDRVEARERELSSTLAGLAGQAATLPDTIAALRGDRAVLARLFRSLEALAPDEGSPAVAVRTLAGPILAWTGRASELRGLPATATTRPTVFVLAGSVTTTLMAGAPVRAPDGTVLGLATAALPVRVQRNIRNEYLRDFDQLADAAEGVEVRYRDVRDEAPDPFPAPAADALTRDAELRAPDGSLLAALRISAPLREEVRQRLRDRYRRIAAGIVLLALLVWMARDARRWRLAVGAGLLRLAPLVLGWPIPADSPLLSPDYLGGSFPLARSPLDLLATAAVVFILSALVLERALTYAPDRLRPLRTLPAILIALLVLTGAFLWIADVAGTTSLDLDSIALVPRSSVHAVTQVALLAVLAAAFLLITALSALSGPPPAAPSARLAFFGALAAMAATAIAYWPRSVVDLPPLPALALFGSAALAGFSHARWRRALRAASPDARAGVVVLAAGLLALVLFPTLAHFAETATRRAIVQDDAALLVGQSSRLAAALAATREAIDQAMLLGDVEPGRTPTGVEELAFSVWSSTELAAGGFSSAVELQDPGGAVISRFAHNLPSLEVAGPPRPLPPGDAWQVSRERVTLASAEREVMHARRRLVYHGQVHGAVHVYLAEDYASLPFVPGRDPYSTLFRPSGAGGSRARSVALLVYDQSGRIRFASDRAPALPPDLPARVRQEPAGFWTTLPLDDQPSHVFLFSHGSTLYGLGYPRRTPSRFVADLVEAFAGLSLLALGVLLALLLVRTLLGRATLSFFSLYDAVRRRFSLRLFVAFIAVAVIPVAVLEVVVRRFVAERLREESADQARERAAVAKKAVEDFAYFRRGESPGQEPVTDDVLVWASSLIRNDIDVFDRGRLRASSKRELYASGLLLPRAAGSVYRALVLEGLPTVLRPERIGSFSTLVVSVPVRLEERGLEPAVLSIPLAVRQREEEAALEELDRTIRLGTFAFLVVAALLGHSIARRISDPIRDLTRATRRVAAGDLGARVETRSRDELRALVDSFNQMAGDLERQRADLERSNRLAAWAEMARQVAHEVKNPLTPIQLSAEHLRRVFGDPGVDFGATLRSCTETILKQVRSLRRIVTEFSDLARPPEPVRERQDLGEIVAEAVAPYRAVLPPGVELALDVPAGLPAVEGDRRLLERAVLNLVENALQAVGERGTIRVQARAIDGRLEVEVEDSGPGLEPDVRDRIFEPFFSTKTGGSGLGLALVRKTAHDHGGGVRLDSPAGGPTRAVLWLPARDAQAPR